MTEKYQGSYQHAVQFKEKLDINAIFRSAYKHVKERRSPFVGSVAWTAVILFAALILVAALVRVLGIEADGSVQAILNTSVQVLILAPCVGGLTYVALKTTLLDKPNREDFFQFFSNPWSIIGVSILTAIVSNVGFLLPHMIAIPWLIAAHILFTLAVPMAAIYRAKPFAAFIGSIQLVTKHFGTFFMLHFVMFVLYLLVGFGAVILSNFAQAGQVGMFVGVAGGVVLAYIIFTRLVPLQFFAIAEIYRILFNVTSEKSEMSDDSQPPTEETDESTSEDFRP
ncbi:hypothetical protein [Aliidiomarina sanyensis]|uniref:Uncharacterized protein n=1 Tax=Aliidiomarina sanyensis TaxID=1249555 RepID=A0A432WRX2_9GAMM|nr:hypothetical protein [Aliidiomarina sanyensis]RUO36515.1 hypothetical protein CWE11_01490 [Aliidiomarina sanyensis]